MNDLKQIICEIQDYLAPQLDGWEQMLYHYLFRHTHLEGKETIIIASRSIGPKIGKGRSDASELARNSGPRKLRSLEEKGVIKILNKTRNGTEVRVFLPSDIPNLIPKLPDAKSIDLEHVDFFSIDENRKKIFNRDSQKCWYCLKVVNQENFSLDHIIPQANGGDHSYKNLVTACFECNSKKHSQSVEDFLRSNYRAQLISNDEFNVCLKYINDVRSGAVVPDM